MTASYLESFLRNSGHILRIKCIIIWQTSGGCSLQTSSGPRQVLLPQSGGKEAAASSLSLRAGNRNKVYSHGLVIVLGLSKKLQTWCPQFTGQITGVPSPVIVFLTLVRSLFNAISLLSHNLTKERGHLFYIN